MAKNALGTLREILDEEPSTIVRDASIQRFEYTFEATWKALKIYLKEKEGIVANSPKAVFRESLTINLVTESETSLAIEMVDDRNLTTHTYIEEIADNIYSRLPKYYHLMQHILEEIK